MVLFMNESHLCQPQTEIVHLKKATLTLSLGNPEFHNTYALS